MSAEDLSKYVPQEDLIQAVRNLTKRRDIKRLDKIEVKRATKGIEGFLSLVLRVKVSFCYEEDDTRHTEVLVLKCMPKDGLQSEIVKETKVFSREGLYFDKIVPMLQRVSASRVEVPLPMCYHSVYGGNNDVIYMEDLAASGHKTPDPKYRAKGLDLEHCILGVKSYGKLHALTLAAERFLPNKKTWIEEFPELKKDPIVYAAKPGDGPQPFRSFVDESAETTLWVAKQLDGLPKEAEESGKLRSVLQRTWDVMCRLIIPNAKGHNVLLHGDCWMNNLMFRYEPSPEGNIKPVGVKFVDLQITRYCHPSLDILYFIYSGTRKPFRVKHIDQLISLYYDSFVDTLKVLNLEPPFTLNEFRSDMFGVYMAFGHFCESLFGPVMILGDEFAPSKAEDMTPEKYEEFISTGNSSVVRDRFASDPHYRAIVSDFVRDFVNAAFPNGLDAPESPLFSV